MTQTFISAEQKLDLSKSKAGGINMPLAVTLSKETAEAFLSLSMDLEAPISDLFAAVHRIIYTITESGKPLGKVLQKWIDFLKDSGVRLPDWKSLLNRKKKTKLVQAFVNVEASTLTEYIKNKAVKDLARKTLQAIIYCGLSPEDFLGLVYKEMKASSPKGMKWKKKGGKTILVPSDEKAFELKKGLLKFLRESGVKFTKEGKYMVHWETDEYYVVAHFSGKGCTIALHDGHPNKEVGRKRLTSIRDIKEYVQENGLIQ